MSLLNVKNALVVSPDLYTNSGAHLPDKVQMLQNPSTYVYPRAYFAQTVEPVSEADDIVDMQSFFGACSGCDNLLSARKPVDEVEGPVSGVFDSSGDITVVDGADRLDVTFPPSAQRRFLVLNELYNKGWSASAGGQDIAVYPTNLVMRGVVVPAGASQVTFEYHSFLPFAGWYTLILLLLGAAVYVLYRRGWQRSSGQHNLAGH
jgi:hypothetical protein